MRSALRGTRAPLGHCTRPTASCSNGSQLLPPAHTAGVLNPEPAGTPQKRIAAHLNTLPWLKLDVDTHHLHAHAAIIARSAGYHQPPSQQLFSFIASALATVHK